MIQPGHSREGRGVHVEVHHTKQMCIQVLYILTYRWRNCDDSQGTAVDPRVDAGGFKSRICPPYPQRVVKGD